MDLRSHVMRGSAFLALRQAVGIIIGFAATLYVGRMIGPTPFGLTGTTMGFYQYLMVLGTWGLNLYLLRHEGDLPREKCHQVFSLYALVGASFFLLSLFLIPYWELRAQMPGLRVVAAVMFIVFPFEIISLVPLAQLERRLEYKKIALIEFISGLLSHATQVVLALAGAGVWALVAGFVVMWMIKAPSYFIAARYRPRWHWDQHLIRELLIYGFSVAPGSLIWQARALVIPIFVGGMMGAGAVGQVSLAIRFIETLSIVKITTYRVSLAVLARLQSDRTRLLRAISQGMRMQIMVLGPLLAGFAIVGPCCIGSILGDKWNGTFEVFPYIAFGTMTNAMFNLHSSALLAIRRNWPNVFFTLIHVAGFALGTYFLIRWIGLLGVGWAEVIIIPFYMVLHYFVRKHIGVPDYRSALWWYVPFVLCLFARQLHWWPCLTVVVLALRRRTWSEIMDIINSLRGRRETRKSA